MDNYRFEVSYIDEYDEYLVKYADFANVIGTGKTINEAIEEAKNNLKLHIESCLELGLPIPKPSISPTTYSCSSQPSAYSMNSKK